MHIEAREEEGGTERERKKRKRGSDEEGIKK